MSLGCNARDPKPPNRTKSGQLAHRRYRGWLGHIFDPGFQNDSFAEAAYGETWTTVYEVAEIMNDRAPIPHRPFTRAGTGAFEASARETLDRLAAEGVVKKEWDGQAFTYVHNVSTGGATEA